jgi:hypothetical protein
MDFYKHLDEDSKLTMELSMREIAQKVNSLNYGTQRLLSAMVHVLREQMEKNHKEWLATYGDLKGFPQTSHLADGIEELLNKGYFD